MMRHQIYAATNSPPLNGGERDNQRFFSQLTTDLKQIVRVHSDQMNTAGYGADALLALNEWLEHHPANHPQRKVVELCIFAGVAADQAAAKLHLSIGHVRHELCLARLFLARRFDGQDLRAVGAE